MCPVRYEHLIPVLLHSLTTKSFTYFLPWLAVKVTLIKNSAVARCQRDALVGLTEMAVNVVRSDTILMLAADKYFVSSVVCDIGVHRDDGSQVENFTMNISKAAPPL